MSTRAANGAMPWRVLSGPVQFRWRPFSLRLRTPLHLREGTLSGRDGVLVALEDAAGNIGVGEASPWSPTEWAEIDLYLRMQAPRHALLDAGLLDSSLSSNRDSSPIPSGLRFALDSAALDLFGKQTQTPAWRILGGEQPTPVKLNALLDADKHVDPDQLAKAVVELRKQGYKTLKIKLGNRRFEDDVAIVQAVHDAAPEFTLRGDVNGAWRPADAPSFLEALAPFPFAYIEEPTRGDLTTLRSVAERSPIPIAFDETLQQFPLTVLSEISSVRHWILKAGRIGNFSEIRHLIDLAKTCGIHLILTGMFEGAVATAAQLHMASAWLPDVTCGLDTSQLFEEDLAMPAHVGHVGVELAAPALAPKSSFLPDIAPGFGLTLREPI
jgi:L-Ala-D/L-Glu epimerase